MVSPGGGPIQLLSQESGLIDENIFGPLQLDFVISATDLVNFVLTNGLCPTKAGQKYAIDAEIYSNLSRQSGSLITSIQ